MTRARDKKEMTRGEEEVKVQQKANSIRAAIKSLT